jgi:hypothetical protein
MARSYAAQKWKSNPIYPAPAGNTGFHNLKKGKYVSIPENGAQLSQINKVLSQTETGLSIMTGYEIDYEQFKKWHPISNS